MIKSKHMGLRKNSRSGESPRIVSMSLGWGKSWSGRLSKSRSKSYTEIKSKSNYWYGSWSGDGNDI